MNSPAGPGDGNPAAVVIYDGECIFCQNYVRLLRLQDGVGTVELLDARSSDPRVQDISQQGYDLDEGMVFLYKGQIFHGADAVQVLGMLSSRSTLFNRLNAALLGRPRLARAVYPWLKLGRRVTLWLRGSSPIRRSDAGDAGGAGDAGEVRR